MPITIIRCPHCGDALELDSQLEGSEVGCPVCGKTFTAHVPAESGATPPPGRWKKPVAIAAAAIAGLCLIWLTASLFGGKREVPSAPVPVAPPAPVRANPAPVSAPALAPAPARVEKNTEASQRSPEELFLASGIKIWTPQHTVRLAELRNGKLGRVVLPGGVKEIAGHAFQRQATLTAVVLPDSIEEIGAYAFFYCEGLKSVVFGKGLKNIGAFAFRVCRDLEEIIIPDGVSTIKESTFSDCRNLKKVVFPDSLKKIEYSAFNSCAFSEITLPAGLEKLNGFSRCNALKSVSIPEHVTEIGSGAFFDCKKLSAITFSKNANVGIIGRQAFARCPELTVVSLPDSVVEIGVMAFESCNRLERADLGRGVKKIDNQAFQYCGKLSSVTFPDTLELIVPFAFDRTALKTVSLPRQTKIPHTAFPSGCKIERRGEPAGR